MYLCGGNWCVPIIRSNKNQDGAGNSAGSCINNEKFSLCKWVFSRGKLLIREDVPFLKSFVRSITLTQCINDFLMKIVPIGYSQGFCPGKTLWCMSGCAAIIEPPEAGGEESDNIFHGCKGNIIIRENKEKEDFYCVFIEHG